MSPSATPVKNDFQCPLWQQGQACKRYMKVHWGLRLVAAAAGALIPLMLAVKRILDTKPDPVLVPFITGIFASLFFFAVVGVIWALHHEKDMPMSFVTGLGVPALFFALLNLTVGG
jgi:hypothetical protein